DGLRHVVAIRKRPVDLGGLGSGRRESACYILSNISDPRRKETTVECHTGPDRLRRMKRVVTSAATRSTAARRGDGGFRRDSTQDFVMATTVSDRARTVPVAARKSPFDVCVCLQQVRTLSCRVLFSSGGYTVSWAACRQAVATNGVGRGPVDSPGWNT